VCSRVFLLDGKSLRQLIDFGRSNARVRRLLRRPRPGDLHGERLGLRQLTTTLRGMTIDPDGTADVEMATRSRTRFAQARSGFWGGAPLT
jgi:hypothetical protein